MLKRRRFLQALSAAIPSAWASNGHLTIGVGTFSYHTLSIDDMIAQLQKERITEIEMSRGEFMLMKPPSVEMCESARKKLDRARIRCVSYYTATIKDDRDLDYAVRNAKIFGATNVSGDATGRMLAAIDQRFANEGLTFGIHNHWFAQKFAYESVDDVLRGLSGRSKAMGATLDVGQMAACGHDPVDAVRRLAPSLKVVHLKDVAGAGAEHNVLFGKGIVDIPRVMRELKKVSFQGLVAIEYEKDTDSNEDMKQQIAFARQLA
jgi:sugar phosphate isomerase/epimerase